MNILSDHLRLQALSLIHNKTHEQIADLILLDKLSQKSVRNESIKNDYEQMLHIALEENQPVMNVYYDLEEKYGVSHIWVMKIVKS